MEKFATRRAAAACLLLALGACALWAAGGAAAQSGRRRPAQQTKPQPTPGPAGESESGPGARPAESKPGAVATFVVMGEEDSAFGVDSVTRRDVMDSFTARLRRSVSVSVSDAGRGTRGEAVKRAKSETTSHVVLVVLEEELGQPTQRGTSRADQRSLVIRTHVFAPKTGALKYSDTVYQRAARPSVGVGGVRLPVPTRTIGRYPSQLELRQAAQDAADRLLSRFQVTAPTDIP
jgi:hypothetical protein